jgi:hypothetical protein
LAARVRRAGASGELTMRMDSGFWSAKTIRACRRHQLRYSITVRQTTPIRQAIATIAADAWVDIVYPDGGVPSAGRGRRGLSWRWRGCAVWPAPPDPRCR